MTRPIPQRLRACRRLMPVTRTRPIWRPGTQKASSLAGCSHECRPVRLTELLCPCGPTGRVLWAVARYTASTCGARRRTNATRSVLPMLSAASTGGREPRRIAQRGPRWHRRRPQDPLPAVVIAMLFVVSSMSATVHGIGMATVGQRRTHDIPATCLIEPLALRNTTGRTSALTSAARPCRSRSWSASSADGLRSPRRTARSL